MRTVGAEVWLAGGCSPVCRRVLRLQLLDSRGEELSVAVAVALAPRLARQRGHHPVQCSAVHERRAVKGKLKWNEIYNKCHLCIVLVRRVWVVD